MAAIKLAIISVYDKTGVADFARQLRGFGVEIISTGGTEKHLREAGVQTTSISSVTGFPEILDGRVKTLHPRIYGGLLALREDEAHMRQIQQHDIRPIDMVVVNLYPFENVVADSSVTLAEALENIDIGGPCMVRAAAKNYLSVMPVTSPEQYEQVINEMRENNGGVTTETRRLLAARAFARASNYDRAIENFLSSEAVDSEAFPQNLTLELRKVQDLRYGENPHQKAALYASGAATEGLLSARQLHGKQLSYNNYMDTDTAAGIVREFEEPCVAIVKHSNPCGVATGESLTAAYRNALATDPVSAFGGIVGLNRSVEADVAAELAKVFVEVIVAPEFSPEAVAALSVKKNVRLLQFPGIREKYAPEWELRRVQGGILAQDQDFHNLHDIDFRVVSQRQPTAEEWQALRFGWLVCKWVKSNAIVYATKGRTIGIGAGQMSRVDAANIAAEKANRIGLSTVGSALASDAFFPFRDGIDVAAEAGATAVVQPGGSVRDQEVIAAADEKGMAMVLTGVRHFRH